MADWGEKVTGRYKIKPGDNLTSISSKLDVPIDSLQLYNNISNPDNVKIGQELLWRRDPSLGENLTRWLFESAKETQESRNINNKIQNAITLSAQPKKIESLSFEDFVEDLKISENPKKLGYRNGRWWPFKTANGDIDVGYGIDLSKQTPEYRARVTKYGLSDDELREDLLERFNTYQDDMKKLFQRNKIDITKVPIKYQRGVLDMLHHLGYTGMSEYKNFFNGIKNNDLDTIRREAKTTFKNKSGKRQVDMKRYNFRLDRYFNNLESGGIIKAQNGWQGGRFTFKKNRLLKNAEASNKRDMRKKFIKSDIPTYKRNRVAKKYQVGGQLLYEDNISQPEIKVDPSIFVSWNNISTNNIELPEFDFSTPSSYSFIDKFNDSILINSINKEEDNKSKEKELTKEENSSKKEEPIIEEYTYKGRNQWAKSLIESYKKAGITNPEALKYLLAQDALESGWGKSAQGKYNYGNLTTGSSWKGNYVQGKDKDAAGNPISQKFRSYNSLDEYTKDKINFLTRLYNFNQNDTADVFISKLLGNNSGKRRYAEARNYGEVLKNVYNSVSKYQHGGTLIFGDPETSEMLTYKMNDGSLKTIPNPGAGFVSGTDPVGQVVVEGAILNKPLGWFSSKAINWAKNLLKNRAGNFTSSTSNEITNNAEKIIKKEDLPSYAKPNWQGDALELTKDRLREGGFDRINRFKIQNVRNSRKDSNKFVEDNNLNYYREELKPISLESQIKILKSNPSYINSSELNLNPNNIGFGDLNGYRYKNGKWGIFKDSPDEFLNNPIKKGDVLSHEFDHYVYSPHVGPSKDIFEYSDNLASSMSKPYELAARGNQIKNYFGLKESEPITGDMLRYAAQNYVKDRGIDNKMTDFFNRIKDFDKMAEWLTGASASISPIILEKNENSK